MKFLRGRAQWGRPRKHKDSARCTGPPRPKIPSRKRRPEEKNLEVVECILKVTRDGKNLVRVATPKLQTEQRNPTPIRCRLVYKKKIIPSRHEQADPVVESMITQRRPRRSMMASLDKPEQFAERRPMAREMCTGRYSNRRRAP